MFHVPACQDDQHARSITADGEELTVRSLCQSVLNLSALGNVGLGSPVLVRLHEGLVQGILLAPHRVRVRIRRHTGICGKNRGPVVNSAGWTRQHLESSLPERPVGLV